MNDNIAKFVRERDAGLAALDIEWARSKAPHLSDEVLLMGMHKARYECTSLASELRHTSAHWLRERGLGRSMGLPLLPEGELPE